MTTVHSLSKEAMELAREEHIPFVAAFIEEGVASSYSSAEETRDVLRAMAHALFQIILHSYTPIQSDEEYYLAANEGANLIKEEAGYLIDHMLKFDDSAN